MRNNIMRGGTGLIAIASYADGSGDLSFNAYYIEDCAGNRRGDSASPTPTREECEKACPSGWVIYEDGPYFRARKAK